MSNDTLRQVKLNFDGTPTAYKLTVKFYNAITQNNCLVKGPHKYDVYMVEEKKTHLNWPNKDRIAILGNRNAF